MTCGVQQIQFVLTDDITNTIQFLHQHQPYLHTSTRAASHELPRTYLPIGTRYSPTPPPSPHTNFQHHSSLTTPTVANMAAAKKWIYTTGGFPQSLKQTTHTPPATSSLKPTEIQVRTKAFAVNPVDVQAINLYRDSASLLPWPLSTLSTTLYSAAGAVGAVAGPPQPEHDTCCDFSGTVEHAGPDAAGLRPGDDVFGFTMAPAGGVGTAAEVLTLDTAAAGVAVAKKPAGWDHAHAAAVPLVWLTARVCIEAAAPWVEAGSGSGDSSSSSSSSKRWLVVLGGSSATGMHTIRLAKARGWRVLATCSARNVEFVRGTLGADEVVDYTTVASVPGEIARRVPGAGDGGDGGDGGVVVVDCVGGTECLDDGALGPRIRRYVTIVGDKQDRSLMGGPATYASHPKMVTRWFLGKVGLGVSYDCVILEARKEWLEEAGRTLAEDDIVVDSTFTFDDLPKALEKMVAGRVRGKLVGVLG